MFTLTISCLTTSNLPCFIDLTFQVPMEYCSLQHRTLLPSFVISTTECCFFFGFIASFFLEFFLYCSLVVYGHLPTWGIHLSVSYLFSLSYCSWDSQGKNTEVVCHSPSPVDYVLSELSTMSHQYWVALHDMAHNFISITSKFQI